MGEDKKGDQKDVWIERREYKRRLKVGQGGGKGEGGGNCRRFEREIWKEGRRGGNIRALRGEGGNRGEGKYENFERGRWKRVEKFVILDNKNRRMRETNRLVYFLRREYFCYSTHTRREISLYGGS